MLSEIRAVERLCRTDIALHFTWMFVIQTILYRFFGLKSFIITFILAFGKEFFDVYIKRGQITPHDILATILGGLIACLLQLKKPLTTV